MRHEHCMWAMGTFSPLILLHTMVVPIDSGKRSAASAKVAVENAPVPSPSTILSVLVYSTKIQLDGSRSANLTQELLECYTNYYGIYPSNI